MLPLETPSLYSSLSLFLCRREETIKEGVFNVNRRLIAFQPFFSEPKTFIFTLKQSRNQKLTEKKNIRFSYELRDLNLSDLNSKFESVLLCEILLELTHSCYSIFHHIRRVFRIGAIHFHHLLRCICCCEKLVSDRESFNLQRFQRGSLVVDLLWVVCHEFGTLVWLDRSRGVGSCKSFVTQKIDF